MPGSPSTPAHTPLVRTAYALVAILLGITGGLGNALISANLGNIQGYLGLTPTEGAWLPAAYLMVNMSTALLLIKFRQQYGLRRFAEIGLTVYAVLTVAHVFVNGFTMAVFVRAASGFAGATVSTLAILYMLQAFKKADMGKGLVLGIGISQLATPLAWLISPALLDMGEWHRLYVFEAGLALCCLAAVVVLKLPPGERIKAFEPLDFLTFALLAPALGLFAAVLTQGRVQWWNTQNWIGYALLVAVVLLTVAILIEYSRKNPLLQTRWLASLETVRFALGALMLRFILSEQTYGAVGLLQNLGMAAEQLQPLYAVMLAGLLAGILTSALTFSEKAVIPQILVSIILVAVGSFMDADATNLTRPHNMFFSQFLLSVAAGMFMGPLLLIGVMAALKNGPSYLVSFAVLFSLTQSIGGLAGPAALGSFQVVREKFHSSQINEHIDPTDSVVAQRLQIQGQIYASTQTDPALRNAQGMSQLSQAATREANVLAFNDVFRVLGILTISFLCWSLVHTVRAARVARKTAPPAPPSSAAL
ncbi:MFS transporter [Pseudomonas capeferrum]|uniref:MFS transporter n=1 Tax=Pseudomonas capeferrum TaxID=1495066 RepID=UPI0015E41730|nr:MFS transporter [Pseudomonas capeferrum]MBA1204404.1 MFS transporter [Pseudomonas capeferrum]